MAVDIKIYPGVEFKIPSNLKKWVKDLKALSQIIISDAPIYTRLHDDDSLYLPDEAYMELIIGNEGRNCLGIGLTIDIVKKLIGALTICLESIEKQQVFWEKVKKEEGVG